MKRRARTLRSVLASKHLVANTAGKVGEREILKGFLLRVGFGEYEIVDRESPDFEVRVGQSVVIGCEVTLLANDSARRKSGSPERRFFAQWKRFAERLRLSLEKESGRLPFLYGSIHFKKSSQSILDKVAAEALIHEIVDVLKRRSGNEALASFDSSQHPILADLVDHIYVKDCYPEKGILWWASHLQSGLVMPPAIVNAILAKNTKAARYDWGAAKEKWLLIYAAGTGLADMAVDIEAIELRDHEIGFTRIYLWDKFSEEVTELFPEHQTILERGRVLHTARLPFIG